MRALLLLVLGLSLWSLTAASQSFTHRCSVSVTGRPEGVHTDLSCEQLGPPSDCNLTVYFNRSLTRSVSTLGCSAWEPQSFCDGVKSLPSPRGSPELELLLDRTSTWTSGNVIVKAAMWPLLYFHGGPACNIVLQEPRITDVTLPATLDDQSGIHESSQVLLFGGGLKATLQGGEVSRNNATFLMAVLANSTLVINNTKFNNNTCVKGVVFGNMLSSTVISGASFASNQAETQGGAVYVFRSQMSVTNTSFLNNTAEQGGGALWVTDQATVALTACTLTNNSSPMGAVVARVESSLTITDSVLVGNVARPVRRVDEMSGSGDFMKLGVGGAIHMVRSTLKLVNTTLTNNTAVIDGGALYMYLGNANITNSTLSGNKAHRHGGAIYVAARNASGNWEQVVAGGQYSEAPALSLTETLMKNNLAQANGGCLMLQPGAPVHIVATNFTHCQAWQLGGALCTELDYKSEEHLRYLDQSTALRVDAEFRDNHGNGENLYVGPYFNLTDSLGQYIFTNATDGRVWNRKRCEVGEFIPSVYCERCPANTYSFSRYILQSCPKAPNFTLSPGGAVLVPYRDFWHGDNMSVHGCMNCDTFNMSTVKRCPNPAACQHNTRCLAEHHPNNRTARAMNQALNWTQYGSLLCTPGSGYKGVLCATCQTPGWGTTGPFTCKRCTGVEVDAKGQGRRPDLVKISLLYVLYWFVQTLLNILAVASAMSLAQGKDRYLRSNAFKTAGPEDVCGTLSKGPVSMDIVKALVVYKEWALVLLGLPVEWLPWSSSDVASSTPCYPFGAHLPKEQHMVAKVVDVVSRLIVGQGTSLHCLQQAWKLWDSDGNWDISAGLFLRAITSAVVVPVVLFVSVLLLLLLWYKLRPGCLRRKKAVDTRSLDSACSAFGLSVAEEGNLPVEDYRHPRFGQFLKQLFLTTVLVTYYSVYPRVAMVAVGMLTCLQVGVGDKRFVLDVRLQCPLTTWRTSWVSGAALAVGIVLIVVCLLVPLFLAGVLIRQAYKDKLAAPDPKSMASKLAYRYADYNVDYAVFVWPARVGAGCWVACVRGVCQVLKHVRSHVALVWDSLLDMQRLLLAAVAVSVMLHPLHQLLLVLLVMGSYLILALWVRPWRSTVVSWLQLGALTVLVASTVAIIACNVEADETVALESPYKQVLPVLVIVANGVYLVCALALLVYCTHKDFWAIQRKLEAGLNGMAT